MEESAGLASIMRIFCCECWLCRWVLEVGIENSLEESELSVDFHVCCGYWSGYVCDLGRNG